MAPTIDPKEFGYFIARHRDARGMTQAAMAEAAGISRPYLAQIEAGKRKGSDEVSQRLLLLTGVPMAQFIDEVVAGALPTEQTEALKTLLGTYDALAEKLPAEQMIEFVENMGPMEEFAAALSQFGDTPMQFGPEGWNELSAKDRALVQRIINRLRKDYEEEADDGDSSEA